MLARAESLVVERLGAGDAVAFAQCAALDATAFPNPSIPGLVAAPVIWVARAGPGGAVSGFLAATCRGRVLDIHGLAVSPEQRRRGAARALLDRAIEAARSARFQALILQVSVANAGAIALYEAAGFVRARRLRRYYARWRFPEGGDGWAMVLPLQR